MSRPQAYCPEQGYQYQILTKQVTDRTWEHCDYAKDRAELKYLRGEYKLAYGNEFEFQSILLPKKYWKEVD